MFRVVFFYYGVDDVENAQTQWHIKTSKGQ